MTLAAVKKRGKRRGTQSDSLDSKNNGDDEE